MAGNVWEWVNDWYIDDYYSNSPGSNPLGPVSGRLRVLRGGGWGNNLRRIRAASRNGYEPDDRISDLGFRCVVSPGK